MHKLEWSGIIACVRQDQRQLSLHKRRFRQNDQGP